jgi:hypothetical protein
MNVTNLNQLYSGVAALIKEHNLHNSTSGNVSADGAENVFLALAIFFTASWFFTMMGRMCNVVVFADAKRSKRIEGDETDDTTNSGCCCFGCTQDVGFDRFGLLWWSILYATGAIVGFVVVGNTSNGNDCNGMDIDTACEQHQLFLFIAIYYIIHFVMVVSTWLYYEFYAMDGNNINVPKMRNAHFYSACIKIFLHLAEVAFFAALVGRYNNHLLDIAIKVQLAATVVDVVVHFMYVLGISDTLTDGTYYRMGDKNNNISSPQTIVVIVCLYFVWLFRAVNMWFAYTVIVTPNWKLHVVGAWGGVALVSVPLFAILVGTVWGMSSLLSCCSSKGPCIDFFDFYDMFFGEKNHRYSTFAETAAKRHPKGAKMSRVPMDDASEYSE